MNHNGKDTLVALLEAVQAGESTVQDALAELKAWPYEDLGDVRVDHHRSLRQGFPEVVYCPGKTPEQVASALERIADGHGVALATRAAAEQVAAAQARVPDVRHVTNARALIVDRRVGLTPVPGVVVAAAGTADIPVAEEAAVTAELMGNGVDPAVRRRRGGAAPAAGQAAAAAGGAGHRGGGGHGGGAAQRGGRPGVGAGHRRAHQRRLRRQLRAAWHRS